MKKTAIMIMVITIASKMFGFLREIALSYFYGASEITDVYLIALTISGTICSFFFAAIANTFIPMYGRIEAAEGEEKANVFASNLINIGIIITIALIVFVFLFTQPIVKIFAIGFDGEMLARAVSFTRVAMISVVASSVLTVLVAYLHIKNRFAITELIGFPLNIAVIAAIIVSYRTNSGILIWGTVAATFLQLMFVMPSVYKTGFRHKPVLRFKDKYIREMMLLAMPVMIGTSVNQINTLVDRTIASSVAIGGISALSYAAKLNAVVQGIFVYSIVVVLYPSISKMASEGKLEVLKDVVIKAVLAILLIVVPATVGIMVLARPIVEIVFGQGAFDERAVIMTTGALLFYSIGMAAFGIQEVISRTFYAIQDTKTPMLNGVKAVIINIVLNLVLSRFMGIYGLALATSIAAIAGSGMLIYELRKKLGSIGLMELTRSTIKLSVASLFMGAAVYLIYIKLAVAIGMIAGLIIAIIVGIIVYATVIINIKIPEVEEVMLQVKGKLGERSKK